MSRLIITLLSFSICVNAITSSQEENYQTTRLVVVAYGKTSYGKTATVCCNNNKKQCAEDAINIAECHSVNECQKCQNKVKELNDMIQKLNDKIQEFNGTLFVAVGFCIIVIIIIIVSYEVIRRKQVYPMENRKVDNGGASDSDDDNVLGVGFNVEQYNDNLEDTEGNSNGEIVIRKSKGIEQQGDNFSEFGTEITGK